MPFERFPAFLLLLIFGLSACAQGGRGSEEAVPLQPAGFDLSTPGVQVVQLHTATPAGQAVPSAGTLPSPAAGPTAAPALPGQWVEFRDQAHGFGLAVPCWWVISPIPPGAASGTLTLRSYDDDYFMANSAKGWWTSGDWPEGAVKLDLTVWQDFDPSLGTLEAFRTTFDPSTSEIAAAQEVQVAGNQAWLVEMRNLVNTADANSRLYVYRPTSGSLLMVSAAPDRALDSSDVQAMLGSLSLSPDQALLLPTVAPSPAIIPLPAECRF